MNYDFYKSRVLINKKKWSLYEIQNNIQNNT